MKISKRAKHLLNQDSVAEMDREEELEVTEAWDLLEVALEEEKEMDPEVEIEGASEGVIAVASEEVIAVDSGVAIAVASEGAIAVAYPSDCSRCELAVPGVAARVECDGATLALRLPRAAAPDECLREFEAVRSAFSLSRDAVLAGLLG